MQLNDRYPYEIKAEGVLRHRETEVKVEVEIEVTQLISEDYCQLPKAKSETRNNSISQMPEDIKTANILVLDC
jgi:hypothetical protein